MKILKNFNNFKLNEDTDSGYLQLIIDGEVHSNWFYLRDAIENGLLEEYFDLEVEDLPWTKYFPVEYYDLADITDMIENCVETEDWEDLEIFLKMVEDYGYGVPDSISFVGETEDSEHYDITYER